jgi:6-pyruvoyltetrahydropterin/6-carboxytetrahydropterin synthase
VTVTGALDPDTGFVANLGVIDRVLAQEVLDKLDHANLNLDIAEFAEGKLIPSSEEIAKWIAERVNVALASSGSRVIKVVVAEEPHLWATWEETET